MSGATRSHRVGVIHAVYAPFGIAPFRDFLASYQRHSSREDHDLLVTFKGFKNDNEIEPYRALLQDIKVATFTVPDQGFDIGTYIRVVEQTSYYTYCFFNSRTRILTGDWLEKLVTPLDRQGVGMTSATGSYQSLLTDFLRARREGALGGNTLQRLVRSSPLNVLRHHSDFPPFPNPHLRTNACAIRRELFLHCASGRMASRRDTARFENGRASISRKLLDLGKEILVVGADGKEYAPPEWPRSGTFWQETQSNLLAADNQTDRYDAGDPVQRATLNALAWANPV